MHTEIQVQIRVCGGKKTMYSFQVFQITYIIARRCCVRTHTLVLIYNHIHVCACLLMFAYDQHHESMYPID